MTSATSAHIPSRQLSAGVGYAMLAGLMWGIIFSVPVLLPDYPPLALSAGRYVAFGLIVLIPAWLDRCRLAALTRTDWVKALELAAIGNLLYYACIAFAAQNAGAPMTAVIIGTLPLVISVAGNLAEKTVRWRKLMLPLLVIGAGLALINAREFEHGARPPGGNYLLGIVAGLGALACWTWYPLRNARWIRERPGLSMTSWATAQGLATLPLALAAFLSLAWLPGFAWPLGDSPARFLALMATLGLCASWLGTLFWNKASRLLPTTLSGQMIVFETLFGLAVAFGLRGTWPDVQTLAGVGLLVAGVLLGVNACRKG